MHFGNSDVQLENPAHTAKVRDVFRAANASRMAIVIHMRSTISRQRPYGAAQARALLDDVLPAAPDVPVQIAHFAGGGGYDDPKVDEALGVLADAVTAHDPRMAHVYFEISGVAGIGKWRDRAVLIARDPADRRRSAWVRRRRGPDRVPSGVAVVHRTAADCGRDPRRRQTSRPTCDRSALTESAGGRFEIGGWRSDVPRHVERVSSNGAGICCLVCEWRRLKSSSKKDGCSRAARGRTWSFWCPRLAGPAAACDRAALASIAAGAFVRQSPYVLRRDF